MKKLLGIAIIAIAAGCATAPKAAPAEAKAAPAPAKAEAAKPAPAKAAPAKTADKDPNPFTNYDVAMRPVKGSPMAVEWQAAAAKDIEKATSCEVVARLTADRAAMDSLLANVDKAYATNPMVATQIAAISQKAMCSKCPKAPAMRKMWTAALYDAASKPKSEYAALFCLDQLRWCGYPEQAKDVRKLGAASKSKAVKDFAEMVAKELDAAK